MSRKISKPTKTASIKKISRITIEITVDDRKKLKVISSLMGISMKTLIINGLSQFLNKDYKELVQTFSDNLREEV